MTKKSDKKKEVVSVAIKRTKKLIWNKQQFFKSSKLFNIGMEPFAVVVVILRLYIHLFPFGVTHISNILIDLICFTQSTIRAIPFYYRLACAHLYTVLFKPTAAATATALLQSLTCRYCYNICKWICIYLYLCISFTKQMSC